MSSSALAVHGDQASWTVEQLSALRQLGIEKATPGDLAVFLNYAQRTGLDPFSRQIYMIGRWDNRSKATKWTIQASIDGLRIVAQRSSEYEGQEGPYWCGEDGQWHDVWIAPYPPKAAKVGVFRRGFRAPLWATAHWEEYSAESSPMWKKMPSLMLAKCAEALALRKAFPNDLSGIYTAEEMAQADRHAPQPEAAPTLTMEDLVVSIAMATNDDELRECWRGAHRAGLLNEPLQDATGMTVSQAITAARDTLAAADQADDVIEAEVVDAD